MNPVTAPPTGIQRGRGGFYRSADDAPYVSDPQGAEVQSGPRKGLVKRIKYGSPSGIGRLIENDAALVKYKQRLSFLGIGMSEELREACKDLALLDADSDEFKVAADTIAVEADRLTRVWLAADRGSFGHLICENTDLARTWTSDEGEILGIDFATQYFISDAWKKLIKDNGLEVLAVEASVVDDHWNLAGTLDRLVRTTKALAFARSSGEIVVVPAGIVIVLDIKFGQSRRAHLIQCASYAQSRPYDTETETRGEWPFDVNRTHALIAHGSFDPPGFTLEWIDLDAGIGHGGMTVQRAKKWNTRDDLWSVHQLT